MKVYIGPHSNWWHCYIYVDYMNKKYGSKWDEPTNSFEKVLEKLSNFLDWFYSVTINKYFARQKRKINVKIHDYDTWGMDHTLAHIILPMLKQLKATKHGSPYVDAEDIPKNMRLNKREKLVFDRGYYDSSLNATDEELEAVSNKFHAQWSWIIDQMIWSFEQEVSEENEYDHYYDPYEPGEFEQEEKDAEDSILDREFRMKMGKFNAEKYKAFVERKQLGFTLFGKYYQSLWD